jgi:hypothetical protein
MKNFYHSAIIAALGGCLLTALGTIPARAQTIEQQLLVTLNDGTHFQVDVQVKGSSLTAANTLGSATIEITYDNTKITYDSSSNWATNISLADGYIPSATDNTTSIRIGITGGGVGTGGSGIPAGFDVGSTYTTWVRLYFTTIDPNQTTSLAIENGSNAIGLFENHANDPNTGKINNQTLTPPVNISNQPLPITLSSFTATPEVSGGVKVSWTTLSEIDCYGFYVQKSNQGTTGFQDIAGSFTPGNGTTTAEHSYTFNDPKVGSGTWYYRLKEVDQNGSVHYFEAVQATALTSVAESNLPTTFGLSQNYPNPFNPTTLIRYALPVRSHVLLTVHNILGQEVEELVNGEMPAGYHSLRFDGARFASGVYFYRIEAGKFVATKSFVLLK